MRLQESGEMYLETILAIYESKGSVRSIDISEYMNFSKPSVSRAIGILRTEGYLTTDKNGFIHLTESGRAIAEKIYERHKVLKDFLVSIGVDEQIAQNDACKIEHDISDMSFAAVKALLASKEG